MISNDHMCVLRVYRGKEHRLLKRPRIPGLSQGLTPTAPGWDVPGSGPYTDIAWSQTAALGVEIAMGDDWEVRSVFREPVTPALPDRTSGDMWVTVLERVAGGKPGQRWAAVLLYTKSAQDTWEQLGPSAKVRVLGHGFDSAVLVASPLDLLDALSRGGEVWPTLHTATRHVGLHDPMLAACRALVAMPGSEGDSVRMMVGMVDYPAIQGRSTGSPLRDRIQRHAIDASLRYHAGDVWDRMCGHRPDLMETSHAELRLSGPLRGWNPILDRDAALLAAPLDGLGLKSKKDMLDAIDRWCASP